MSVLTELLMSGADTACAEELLHAWARCMLKSGSILRVQRARQNSGWLIPRGFNRDGMGKDEMAQCMSVHAEHVEALGMEVFLLSNSLG
eukprot:1075592-Pelagomonas_calceolata.AAC.4